MEQKLQKSAHVVMHRWHIKRNFIFFASANLFHIKFTFFNVLLYAAPRRNFKNIHSRIQICLNVLQFSWSRFAKILLKCFSSCFKAHCTNKRYWSVPSTTMVMSTYIFCCCFFVNETDIWWWKLQHKEKSWTNIHRSFIVCVYLWNMSLLSLMNYNLAD